MEKGAGEHPEQSPVAAPLAAPALPPRRRAETSSRQEGAALGITAEGLNHMDTVAWRMLEKDLDVFQMHELSSSTSQEGDGWAETLPPAARRVGDALLIVLGCTPGEWRGEQEYDTVRLVESPYSSGFERNIAPVMFRMLAPEARPAITAATSHAAIAALRGSDHAGEKDAKATLRRFRDEELPAPWQTLAVFLFVVLARQLNQEAPLRE